MHNATKASATTVSTSSHGSYLAVPRVEGLEAGAAQGPEHLGRRDGLVARDVPTVLVVLGLENFPDDCRRCVRLRRLTRTPEEEGRRGLRGAVSRGPRRGQLPAITQGAHPADRDQRHERQTREPH